MLRLVLRSPMHVASVTVPLWASGIAVIVAASLALWASSVAERSAEQIGPRDYPA